MSLIVSCEIECIVKYSAPMCLLSLSDTTTHGDFERHYRSGGS